MVFICAAFPQAVNANSFSDIIKGKNVSKEKIKQAKNNIEFKRQKTSSIIKQLKIREKKEI